jgi:hypothetical protein
MNFDNTWWNRTFKSSMQLMFRSVTWKFGNLRATGGAFWEQGKEFYNAAREGRRPKLERKMAWLLGVSIVTATISTMIQYLMIKEMPKGPLDLVFPRVDKDGTRVSTPTYWRDILSLKRGPIKYAVNSMSGFMGRIIEDWQNKDYYGNQIYNPYDPLYAKTGKSLVHMVPLPFSVSSWLNSSNAKQKALSLSGFNKAPAYINHTDMQNQIYELYQTRFGGGVKSELETKRSQAYRQYDQLKAQGRAAEAAQLKQETINAGIATDRGFAKVDQNVPADKYMFNRLPQDDKDHLLKSMTEQEKAYYGAKASSKSAAPSRSNSRSTKRSGGRTVPKR